MDDPGSRKCLYQTCNMENFLWSSRERAGRYWPGSGHPVAHSLPEWTPSSQKCKYNTSRHLWLRPGFTNKNLVTPIFNCSNKVWKQRWQNKPETHNEIYSTSSSSKKQTAGFDFLTKIILKPIPTTSWWDTAEEKKKKQRKGNYRGPSLPWHWIAVFWPLDARFQNKPNLHDAMQSQRTTLTLSVSRALSGALKQPTPLNI